MDEMARPAEAPRHQALQINPIPAWFINFFPAPEAAPASFSWAQHFAIQLPTTRLPAWCRVAVEAHRSSRRTGLIMKRISLPRFRAVAAPTAATVPPTEQAGVGEEEARRVRPKLSTFIPTVAKIQMVENTPSHAEIMSSIMKAKVAVANHYYTHFSANSVEENQQSRTNRYFKYVPRKRLLRDDDTLVERDALTNRNRLRTYSELAHILSRAADSGAAEINLTAASSAEAAAALLQSGRDPRVHLAAQGIPDLSVIADATEVADSPGTLPKHPGAMSPVKRLAGQSSPIKTPTKRLTDSLVPLLPSSSPKASPSPTKSSSPSTPLRPSASLTKRAVSSPAGFPRSPVHMQSPSQLRDQRPGTPTFSSPLGSKIATPSSAHSRRVSSHRDTPTKQRLRAATTPSRRNTLDAAASPYQMFSPQAATPSRTDSPLGLVASLPDQLRSVAASPATPVVVGDVSSIDFGPSSPSFTHATWLKPPMSPGEVQRSKNVSNALRRRSEPLARSLHKARFRKRSMSPQKTIEGIESPAKEFADSTMSLGGDADETVIRHDVSDTISNNGVAAVEQSAPVVSTLAITPKKNRGIVDVDMRKSLDIFAFKASPRIGGKPAMEELARIAKERCDGSANVMIFQENGRLVVRFKLPTEYAPMFPESQGADESHFSSPPDLPASARLRMKNQQGTAGTQAAPESPINEAPSSPALHSSPCKGDRTLAVSDFDFSSPMVNAPLSPSIAVRLSAKRTTALRAFSVSPAKLASPFADSTCISFPDATIDNDDTTIPSLRSPTQLDFADAPRGFSSPSKPEALPAKDDVPPAIQPSPAQPPLEPNPESDSEAAVAPSTGVVDKNDAARQKRARLSSPLTMQKQTAGGAVQPITGTEATSSKPVAESPDREFVRDFIKRARPKTSPPTTAAQTTAKPRLPLEAKSPNAERVHRPRRKLDEEDFESEKNEGIDGMGKANIVAKSSDSIAPRAKQSIELAALATTTQDASDDDVEDDGENGDENPDEEKEADPDADELAAEPSTATTARRSSRLRGKTTTAVKSSIPGPIKAGRSKAGLSSARNEQQDLTRQTLANTRRNKGKALSARRALEKLADGAQEDDEERPSEVSALRAGKSVVWKEPLAAYGESRGETQADAEAEDKPKRGRGAPKAPAGRKRGTGRVTKPAAKSSAGAAKQRISKMAAAPKRPATGTPARITRSRARD